MIDCKIWFGFGHVCLSKLVWFQSCAAHYAEADRVFLWNAADRNLIRTSPTGIVGRSIAFSAEPVLASDKYFPGWQPMTMGNAPSDSGHHIAVGGKFGSVAVLDGVTLQPLATLKDAQSAVDDVKFCGGPRQMLACGSHDLVVDVYDVEKGYVHLSRCQGHQATVTHLDWSLPLYTPNGVPATAGGGQRLLQTNCGSYEILHWDPITGRQVLVNQRDTQWESFTCILGFSVMGLWPDGSDGTDINAVDRSRGGQTYVEDVKRPNATLKRRDAPASCSGLEGAGFIVTADDFGKVKLFNYPCVFNDAPYREYKGHASHAMCIRFTADDGRVITAGGHDRAMMQFKTVGIKANEEIVKKPPPPAPNRKWGPIDGGKAYGWIEEKSGGGGRPVPKAMPSIKLSGSFGGARALTSQQSNVGGGGGVGGGVGGGGAMGRSATVGQPTATTTTTTTNARASAGMGSRSLTMQQQQQHVSSTSSSSPAAAAGRYAPDDDFDDADIVDDEF